MPSEQSNLLKIGGAILGLAAVAGIIYGIYRLVEYEKKKKPIPINPPTQNNSSNVGYQNLKYSLDNSQPTNNFHESDNTYGYDDAQENVYQNRTPDLRTKTNENPLYDSFGNPVTGPQPIDADSAQLVNDDGEWAPVDTMSSNEALSMANPDNAQWFSGNLLPNAELQCNQDGMITDGPTYEELAIFTPKLMEASVASRYFMDPPTVKRNCGGDILRPLPLITASAGSRENLVWGISSIQQSDMALYNAGQEKVFCSG